MDKILGYLTPDSYREPLPAWPLVQTLCVSISGTHRVGCTTPKSQICKGLTNSTPTTQQDYSSGNKLHV